MLKVAEYRQHAVDCRRMANAAKDPTQCEMLEGMAVAWDRLADERERFLQTKNREKARG